MKKVATLFFALLPFALSSFTANAEDSPQQDEAFDYIKDRQSKLLQVENCCKPKTAASRKLLQAERNQALLRLLRRSAVYETQSSFA